MVALPDISPILVLIWLIAFAIVLFVFGMAIKGAWEDFWRTK